MQATKDKTGEVSCLQNRWFEIGFGWLAGSAAAENVSGHPCHLDAGAPFLH